MISITVRMLLFVICALLLTNLLKSAGSGLSTAITLFAAAAVMCFACTQLSGVFEFVMTLTETAGIEERYISIAVKCIGICFLGDFASDICSDCGENSLADGSRMICKCSILVISLPMYTDIFNMILKLWKNI